MFNLLDLPNEILLKIIEFTYNYDEFYTILYNTDFFKIKTVCMQFYYIIETNYNSLYTLNEKDALMQVLNIIDGKYTKIFKRRKKVKYYENLTKDINAMLKYNYIVKTN